MTEENRGAFFTVSPEGESRENWALEFEYEQAVEDLVWSPGEEKLAFVTDDGTGWNIFIWDSATGEIVMFQKINGNHPFISW